MTMRKAIPLILCLAGLSACSQSSDGTPDPAALLSAASTLTESASPAGSSLSISPRGTQSASYTEANFDFGSATVGSSSAPVEFVIYNRHDSQADLIIGEISINGPAAGDYAVTAPENTGVAPGGSTQFSIQYTPGGSGRRDATVTIKSNDEDHPRYQIHLTGRPGVDIHMVGYTAQTGIYRKNQTETPLPALDPNEDTRPTAIHVSGSDVYISGNLRRKTGHIYSSRAVYWKNGTLFQLAVPDTSKSSFARDIIVDGSDVYIAGMVGHSDGGYTASYWKNGVRIDMPTARSSAASITLSDGDIYIGGGYHDGTASVPCYWKNGVLVPLTALVDGLPTRLGSIAVAGADVYAAGQGRTSQFGREKGVYWRNGTLTQLTSSSTFIGNAPAVQATPTDYYVLVSSKDTFGPIGSSSVHTSNKKIHLKKAPNIPSYNPRYRNSNATATAMFVLNNEIYSAGRYRGLAVWKNEKLFSYRTDLQPTDIFVTGP